MNKNVITASKYLPLIYQEITSVFGTKDYDYETFPEVISTAILASLCGVGTLHLNGETVGKIPHIAT